MTSRFALFHLALSDLSLCHITWANFPQWKHQVSFCPDCQSLQNTEHLLKIKHLKKIWSLKVKVWWHRKQYAPETRLLPKCYIENTWKSALTVLGYWMKTSLSWPLQLLTTTHYFRNKSKCSLQWQQRVNYCISQSENFQTKKGELTLPIRRLGTTISLQRSWRGAKQSKGQGKKEKGESVPLHIFCQNPGWPEAISEVSAKGSLVSESTLLSHKLWWEIPSSTYQHKKLSQRCQANT